MSKKQKVIPLRLKPRDVEVLEVLKSIYRSPSLTHTVRLAIEDAAKRQGVLKEESRGDEGKERL